MNKPKKNRPKQETMARLNPRFPYPVNFLLQTMAMAEQEQYFRERLGNLPKRPVPYSFALQRLLTEAGLKPPSGVFLHPLPKKKA